MFHFTVALLFLFEINLNSLTCSQKNLMAKVNIFQNKLSGQTWHGLPSRKLGNQTLAGSESNKTQEKQRNRVSVTHPVVRQANLNQL